MFRAVDVSIHDDVICLYSSQKVCVCMYSQPWAGGNRLPLGALIFCESWYSCERQFCPFQVLLFSFATAVLMHSFRYFTQWGRGSMAECSNCCPLFASLFDCFEPPVLPGAACCVVVETINFTNIPHTDQRLDCRMLLEHFSGIHQQYIVGSSLNKLWTKNEEKVIYYQLLESLKKLLKS